MKAPFIALLAAIMLGGGMVWLGRVENPEDLVGKPAPRRGAPAPTFTLSGLNGETHILSEYQGQTVIINFWATWCEPCREEMPDLQEIHEQYADDGLVILAVNAGESEATIQEFVDEFGLTFPILPDPGFEVSELYEVQAYPSTYFVDADGRIRVDTYSGPMTSSFIESHVLELLY